MAELIDARTISDETLETPVCIIGGGPMGLAVSIRLSELGISHLVLESGGRMPGDNQDLAAGETTGHPYDELDTTRIRALGGTTHIWGGHSKPLRPEDFVPRPHIANSGWPISHAEHQKYIGKAAELVGLENRWRAEDYGDFSRLIDPQAGFFDFEAFKLSQVNYNPSQWAKGDFFEANKGRIDTRILLHATARELVFAKDGTVAALTVTAGEKSFSVSARIFVLACGGIENARFLLINQRRGDSPLKDLPAIGRYFMEHPRYTNAGTWMLARPLPDYFFGVREVNGEVNQMRYFLKEKHQRSERLLSAMFYPIWPSDRDADFAAPSRH